MGTDLGIRLVIVRLEILDASFAKLCGEAGRPDLAPVVRLNARGDFEDGLERGHLEVFVLKDVSLKGRYEKMWLNRMNRLIMNVVVAHRRESFPGSTTNLRSGSSRGSQIQ